MCDGIAQRRYAAVDEADRPRQGLQRLRHVIAFARGALEESRALGLDGEQALIHACGPRSIARSFASSPRVIENGLGRDFAWPRRIRPSPPPAPRNKAASVPAAASR